MVHVEWKVLLCLLSSSELPLGIKKLFLIIRVVFSSQCKTLPSLSKLSSLLVKFMGFSSTSIFFLEQLFNFLHSLTRCLILLDLKQQSIKLKPWPVAYWFCWFNLVWLVACLGSLLCPSLICPKISTKVLATCCFSTVKAL